ncbi:MAG: SDR family NAD(P)-dependent oxidoreductase [Candidatus Omnitrophota bacterium]|jgi:short-subunit dehydrogenase
MDRKNVIIIGASSGIGRELAKIFCENGYVVGLAARRLDLLAELKKELPGSSFITRMDIAHPDNAMKIFEDLVKEMGGLDIVVIAAGIGFINADLLWEKEKSTIDVNASGFAAMANVAMKRFIEQGSGQIVGISSIAAIRGDSYAPAYSASKAFMSNYLEGLRSKVKKMKVPITVTEIQPGFVDTAMAKGDGLFWVAPVRKAATQIFIAVKKKREHAYVTRRWRIIAWLLKIIPRALLPKIY